MLSNMGYGLFAPFVPLVFNEREINIDYLGCIFAVYSVAIIICSPFIGYIINKYHKRRLVFQIGLFCMAACLLGYGVAFDTVESNEMLIIIIFALRFMQGFASSAIQTTCFSISSLLYPDH